MLARVCRHLGVPSALARARVKCIRKCNLRRAVARDRSPTRDSPVPCDYITRPHFRESLLSGSYIYKVLITNNMQALSESINISINIFNIWPNVYECNSVANKCYPINSSDKDNCAECLIIRDDLIIFFECLRYFICKLV